MTSKQIKIRVSGIQPMMLNNVAVANPLHPLAKKLRELTSKAKKNDEDYYKINRLQFEASWYLDSEGHYVLPSDNLLKSFEAGARENKKGATLLKNVQILEDNLIIHFDGMDKSIDELFDKGNGKNVDIRLVSMGSGIKKSKVTATRVIIDKWWLEATIIYDPTHINLSDIELAADNAGRREGVGTYRAKYGRYEVEFLKK